MRRRDRNEMVPFYSSLESWFYNSNLDSISDPSITRGFENMAQSKGMKEEEI